MKGFLLWRIIGLNFLTNALSLFCAALQIGVQLVLVSQIISDDGINIIQGQHVEAFMNGFRDVTLTMACNHSIERNASATDTYRSVFIGS